MTSKLTTYRNEEKIAALDLEKIGSALNFSKEDVELYFFMLSTIAYKHQDKQIKKDALKFLLKQDKLQNVLNDLLERHTFLHTQWNTENSASRKEITRQLIQLDQELRIFYELHFRVKRTYIRFTNEHFQAGWGQSFMVA